MYCFEKDFYEVAITSAVGVLGIASQIPCIILNGYEPINGSIMSMGFGTALGAGIRLPLRYEKWKLFHNIMKKEEFKEEKKLYLEYVKDIAKFLKSMGVSSDLSGAFLCKMLIDGGILSEDKVEYANHLITGLKHNDKAVLFDPSAPLVLLPMSGLLEFKTQKGKIVTKSFDEEYCYEEKISEHDFEKVNRINLRKLKSLEPLDVSEEMFGEYLEAFTTYIRYSDEISDFKDKEMPKIKRLSKLNKIVTPYFEKEKSSGE